jgi:hypothetical protein
VDTPQEASKPQHQAGKTKVKISDKRRENDDSDVINTSSPIPKTNKKQDERAKRRNGQTSKVEQAAGKGTS